MNEVMEMQENRGRAPDLEWQAAQGRLVPEYQVTLLAEGLVNKLREVVCGQSCPGAEDAERLMELTLVMRDVESELRTSGTLCEGSAIGLFQDLIPAMRWVYA